MTTSFSRRGAGTYRKAEGWSHLQKQTYFLPDQKHQESF